jgi:hypothetical protein
VRNQQEDFVAVLAASVGSSDITVRSVTEVARARRAAPTITLRVDTVIRSDPRASSRSGV